ncbi:MAG TPA: HAMP domain-containing sensor histidine kinase [Rhizomicrobium sp.]|jgi:signal transduction histidine kinase|nr:HAMP domain-containing sensor histidine kinase [Rhizomicrobium sp.]
MPVPGPQTRARKNSLLARYSDTFGEMQLRKYTERAIRAARVEAELNSRSKSAFLSTMSHELRTPLNAIIGFSDLIKTPGATSARETSEYARHIANAGRRLLDVVCDVLDMSRLESASLTLDSGPCSIDEILQVAAENAKEQFAAKQQPIDLRLEKNLPEIQGDARRLRQLFANLLSNASKFTPEKGRILVMAKAVKDGGVTIAIADTGAGMTHEQIVLALKPFAQVQGHLARAQEGAGLGLPLALGLARLHGGSLYLDSQPGAGTTAIVTLPRNAATQSLGAAPAKTGKAA